MADKKESIPKWVFDELNRNAEAELTMRKKEIQDVFSKKINPLVEELGGLNAESFLEIYKIKLSDIFDLTASMYAGWNNEPPTVHTSISIGEKIRKKIEKELTKRANILIQKLAKANGSLQKQYDTWRHDLLFGEVNRDDVKPFKPTVKF